jgi:hypothetical protein
MAVPRRLNCWEFRNCGREHGGLMVDVLGECPVANAMKFDGHNGGVAAGRACWIIPNSGCRSSMNNINSSRNCHECEFYRRVISEEKEDIQGALHSVPV